MCGICGVFEPGERPGLSVVQAMCEQLAHRGPDGTGWLLDDDVALGHTRLALVDVAGGVQPMGTPDEKLWVSFNGEIFNHVELRRQLQDLGHVFTTRSDTEVILRAWRQWGLGSLDRFNGQWAFALWDRTRRQLVLARDRLGVRPLYYHLAGRRLLFASEVKALFADPRVPRHLDAEGLAQVFSQWSALAPTTVFSGIQQLPPGHVAFHDADGFRSLRWWRAEFPDRGTEESQDLVANSQRLREVVVEATRLRFERSDFPVGAYLSGGLDSAVTAAAIRHFTDVELDTFSVRFTDAEFDEGSHQEVMSRLLGTRHHAVEVSPADIAEVFPTVVHHAETPLLRTAPAPMFLLSELVREAGCKVVVTGEGADEVLGGYDIFREARVRQFWAHDPGSRMRSRAAELLYPWLGLNPGRAPAFARGFFGQDLDPRDPALSHRPRWNATSALQDLLNPEMGGAPGRYPELPAEASRWDPLSRAQWLELTALLPGYILSSQGDRMLMANSVEGRFPFLDPELFEFAAGLPARHKLFGLDEKFLLRHAFSDLVPESVRNRPKQPYRAPDASSFFTGSEPDWVGDVTSTEALLAAGVFDVRRVSGLITKARNRSHRFGNTDNMRTVAVLSTQLLHEQFIRATRPAPARSIPAGPVHEVDLTAGAKEAS